MKNNTKRYSLHSKIKKKGFRYSPYLKTIYVPYTLEDYPKEILILRDTYNYSIQTEII